MAETATNGHDNKAKWSDPEFRKRYLREYRLKKKAEAGKKKHALAGRKQSKETIEKRLATMAAKRARKQAAPDVEDAIVYLRKAVRSINTRVGAGGEETMADLMTKLALKTLQGEF